MYPYFNSAEDKVEKSLKSTGIFDLLMGIFDHVGPPATTTFEWREFALDLFHEQWFAEWSSFSRIRRRGISIDEDL